jgi:hypothetical protein
MGKSEFENLLEMGFCYFQFSSLQKTSATAVDSRPDSEFQIHKPALKDRAHVNMGFRRVQPLVK